MRYTRDFPLRKTFKEKHTNTVSCNGLRIDYFTQAG